MIEKSKIRILLRGRLLKGSANTVALQIYHKGKRGYISLGRKCLPEQWDKKRSRFNSRFPLSNTYNSILDLLECKANNILYYLTHSQKNFKINDFINLWKSKSIKEIELLRLSFSMGSFEFQSGHPIKPSLTYIMLDETVPGCVKIGKSINPEKRERTLQAQNPVIKLLATTERDIEKELHAKFQNLRVRGEWFKIPEEQINEVVSTYGFTVVDRC